MSESQHENAQHDDELTLSKSHRRILIIVAVVIVGVVVLGIATRLQAQKALGRNTEDAARTIVSTIKPQLQSGTEELILPGDVQAFADAPIYARTNGYLKSWKVDIGSHVKKGQVLAEIDAPEIDQEFLQAKADLASAIANAEIARTTANRWIELRKTDSVSQQDADEKISNAAAMEATRESARANVERLRQLQGFDKIIAPFDGVITARNTDTGALISAASGVELFHITASKMLRVYVQVPQNYAPSIKPGLAANLEFTDRPKERFAGKLVRSADAIDQQSRTLRAEIEVDNAQANLLPGTFATVHLQLPVTAALRLPVNTLIFRGEGLQVATVDNQQHIRLKTIELGRDYGTEVEVIEGLSNDDNVVLSPPDAIIEGQAVHVVEGKIVKAEQTNDKQEKTHAEQNNK